MFNFMKNLCHDFICSQQFILWQYPAEPPHIILVESKGLDEERHEKLITIVQNKAQELSSRPMLIALCEVNSSSNIEIF